MFSGYRVEQRRNTGHSDEFIGWIFQGRCAVFTYEVKSRCEAVTSIFFVKFVVFGVSMMPEIVLVITSGVEARYNPSRYLVAGCQRAAFPEKLITA